MSLQIELLEESFDLIAGRGADLVDCAFSRLKELDPRIKLLLARADEATLEATLLGILIILRRSLRNLDAMAPLLQRLGAHYADRGVDPRHYGAIGIALLDAMAEIGGKDWKPAYISAWAEAYAVVWGLALGRVTVTEIEALTASTILVA